MLTTTALVAGLRDLPLYRVRVTSADPGYRLIDFGRRLRSALAEADRFSAIGGGLAGIVEAYDRHSGDTLRIVGG